MEIDTKGNEGWVLKMGIEELGIEDVDTVFKEPPTLIIKSEEFGIFASIPLDEKAKANIKYLIKNNLGKEVHSILHHTINKLISECLNSEFIDKCKKELSDIKMAEILKWAKHKILKEQNELIKKQDEYYSKFKKK